ncbi:MAG: penicillin-binding protein 2, partial [Desulfovibrio sp.]|nr:penicillin-binding protein 2 [Desulfovibrio sp.]
MNQLHDIAIPAQTDAAPHSRKSLFRSWLKIQVESERYQPPHNGLILLQFFIGILFFVLVTRLWYLQMQRGEEFARLSLENRLRQERVFAPRGRIMDRIGKIIADNRTAYGLSLVREDCRDIPATLTQISVWSGIPVSQIWEKYQQDRSKVKSFEPILMLTDISFDLLARIESEIFAWPGLEIVVRTKRNYPEKDIFAHVLGYVAEVNEKEMEEDSALITGDFVGKAGLELELEKQLRGQKGLFDVEVDAHGRALGKTLKKEPHGGREIGLSLDLSLQRAAWDALRGETGCVVVMDPDSGKLRALVTSPAYDNNLFAAGISKRDWEALRTSNRFPLQNRVIQSVYPPGSVWKLVM